MMKFIIMLLMMIPLSFLKNKFWFNQYLYFIMSFIFMINMKFNFQIESVSYFFMCDLLSYVMILLSFWICTLMILASAKIFNKKNHFKIFLFLLLLLLLSLVLTFSTMNLFIFYLFFEMSLIPTLILIIGWGYQPERIQAGSYLLFYTLFASLPMMIFMFYYYNKNYSLVFFLMDMNLYSFLMFLFMNMVFLVKMPMYFVHLWLPKAHVEAPVSGSMILAGVMLKLGGYGMLRMINIFNFINNSFNYIIISISLLGGVIVSLICLRQSDMKSLIAYSSVAHMGLVLGGMVTFNLWGLCGSLSMMLAHGLCSSGLFCLANICYERLGSRSLYLNKGMINLMPSMSLWWFLLCSSNMAAPPSFNLLGEIMLINSLVSWSYFTMIMLVFTSFFSAVYSLYLYAYTQHGMMYSGLYTFYAGNNREFLLLILHWLPLNLLILKSELFFMWI
uniref:NADH-ubiquinone oxidoreductase chain 4 n=1 Tax=Callicerus obscurus TaxID=877884 RepID=A0A0S2M6V6_9COLE|nr:NADH dehydrogenase subunit 4 [Callicerus obscurus]ALO70427.1 NADH deshydrogenase subunit 4 [Callicerus obscurus]